MVNIIKCLLCIMTVATATATPLKSRRIQRPLDRQIIETPILQASTCTEIQMSKFTYVHIPGDATEIHPQEAAYFSCEDWLHERTDDGLVMYGTKTAYITADNVFRSDCVVPDDAKLVTGFKICRDGELAVLTRNGDHEWWLCETDHRWIQTVKAGDYCSPIKLAVRECV